MLACTTREKRKRGGVCCDAYGCRNSVYIKLAFNLSPFLRIHAVWFVSFLPNLSQYEVSGLIPAIAQELIIQGEVTVGQFCVIAGCRDVTCHRTSTLDNRLNV